MVGKITIHNKHTCEQLVLRCTKMKANEYHKLLLNDGFKVIAADDGITTYENEEELQITIDEPGHSAEEQIEKHAQAGSKYDPKLCGEVFEMLKNQ